MATNESIASSSSPIFALRRGDVRSRIARLAPESFGLDAAIAGSTAFAILWAIGVLVVSLGAMMLFAASGDTRFVDAYGNADVIAAALALPGGIAVMISSLSRRR
jgi:hypothetical protein